MEADEGIEMGAPSISQSIRRTGSREPSALKQSMQALLGHAGFTTVMTTFTVYALFGDDLKLLAFPHEPDADPAFVALSSIAFFLFLLELVLSCYAKDGYCPWPTVRC